jgi:hypothetical protein
MEDILSRAHYKTQSLHKELTEVIVKLQVELKTAELPLDRRMRNLQEKLITIWSHH